MNPSANSKSGQNRNVVFSVSKSNRALFMLVISLELIIGLSLLVNVVLSLAIEIIFLGTILIVVRPLWGYLLLIMSLPFSGIPIVHIGSSTIELTQALFALTLIGWLIHLAIKAKLHFERSPLDSMLALFFSWILLSSLWSTNFLTGLLESTKTFWAFALLPLSYNLLKNRRDLQIVLKAWIISSIITAVLISFCGEYFLSEDPIRRPLGLSAHANIVAMYLSFSSFVLLGYYGLVKSYIKKALLAIAWLLVFTSILMTASRGALIGVLCGIAFIGMTKAYKFKTTILFLVLIILTIPFVTQFGGDKKYEYLKNRLAEVFVSDPTEAATLIARYQLWGVAINMIKDYHLCGIGVGGTRDLLKRYDEPLPTYTRAVKEEFHYHTHSVYLDILLHFGIIGAVLFLFVLVGLIKYLIRAGKEVKSTSYRKMIHIFEGGLIAFVIHGIVDFNHKMPEAWLFLGITVAMTKIFLEEKNFTSSGEL